jgi:hypothetical protein
MMRLRGATAALLIGGLLLAAIGLATPPQASAQSAECTSAIDLMLVLDGSESIAPADFETMRGFVSELVGHFTISPSDAHAGIVQFAGQGQGRIETGVSGDSATVQGAIASMTQIVGATDIQEGISYGQGELTSAERGVPQVMIVLTDGVHNQEGDPIAEALAARDAGTQIFAIAVGSGPDANQLVSIAGDASRVYTVDNFSALAAILDPLVEVVCPPEPEPTPPGTSITDPPGSQPGGPDSSDVLDIVLPATGSNDLPPGYPERGRGLFFQAAIGLMFAGTLMLTAYVIGSRR